MNWLEMSVLIALIVVVGNVVKAKLVDAPRRRGRDETEESSAENRRLKDEVRALHERIAVLERIAVEKENSLEREIEKLRDR